jgi:hypothetical protein
VSGTLQTLGVGEEPGLITLRVRDMNGNPMAGGLVEFYQAVYAWEPPCPPRGRCAQAPLLATRTDTAISGADGTVTFVPASIGGIATNLEALAVTGNTSTVSIEIEQHP